MILSLTVLAFIFIVGLVTGSFLNVVILRTVSGESIVFPGSKCPKCQKPLKWYHNIPVLSYLFLKGKCAFCNEKISIQYPIVELLTGILYVLMFVKYCSPFDAYFGLSVLNPINIAQVITYIFVLIACSLFIVIAGTDFIEMKVSDKHTIPLICSGILYSIVMSTITLIFYIKEVGTPKLDWSFFLTCPILYTLACAIVGFCLMEIIRRTFQKLLNVECFGEGDSYIYAGIGAVIGALMGVSPVYSSFLPILSVIIGIFILSAIIAVIFVFPMYLKNLIVNKNYFTLGSIMTFFIYTCSYFFARKYGLLENKLALYASIIVLIFIGLFLCTELLKGIKDNKQTYAIPFGPSLIIAALIVITFIPFS